MAGALYRMTSVARLTLSMNVGGRYVVLWESSLFCVLSCVGQSNRDGPETSCGYVTDWSKLCVASELGDWGASLL